MKMALNLDPQYAEKNLDKNGNFALFLANFVAERFFISSSLMANLYRDWFFSLKMSLNLDSQYAERNLDKMDSTINGTFTGKEHALGVRVYFSWNPRLKAIKSTS